MKLLSSIFSPKGRLDKHTYFKCMGIALAIQFGVLWLCYLWAFSNIKPIGLMHILSLFLLTILPAKFVETIINIVLYILIIGTILLAHFIFMGTTCGINIRRLHDINKGAHYFILGIAIISLISFLILEIQIFSSWIIIFIPTTLFIPMWLILSYMPGTEETNKYGPDPLDSSSSK